MKSKFNLIYESVMKMLLNEGKLREGTTDFIVKRYEDANGDLITPAEYNDGDESYKSGCTPVDVELLVTFKYDPNADLNTHIDGDDEEQEYDDDPLRRLNDDVDDNEDEDIDYDEDVETATNGLIKNIISVVDSYGAVGDDEDWLSKLTKSERKAMYAACVDELNPCKVAGE